MKMQPLRVSIGVVVHCCLFFSAASWSGGEVPTKGGTLRIVPDQDLVYMGAFRVPHNRGLHRGAWLGYAAFGLAFNPSGNGGAGSLYAVGPDNNRYSYVAEFSIPVPKVASKVDNLESAVLLQGFADIGAGLEGSLSRLQLYQNVYGLAYMPPFPAQPTAKLYWTSIYDYHPHVSDMDIDTLGCSNPTLANPSPAGRWHLAGVPSSYSTKWLFNVPTSWADRYLNGQYLAVGRHNVGATGQQAGYGPSLYTTAPWSEGGPPRSGAALAATELLRYPHDHPMERNHSHGDWTGGGAWLMLGAKSAVIFSYTKAMRSAPKQRPNVGRGDYPWEDYKRPSCLAGGNFCWPESEIYGCAESDLKSQPYVAQLKFFDPVDLALVATGRKLPYEVHPYADYQIERYLFKKQGAVGRDPGCRSKVLGGVAYDSVRQRIYVEEIRADGPYPVIHVFKLQDKGDLSDSTPPSVPTDITHHGPVVSWTASRSSRGGGDIVYVVFKMFPAFTSPDVHHQSYPAMWRPVASTTALIWTDPAFSPGDSYNVTAYDCLMHASNVLN